MDPEVKKLTDHVKKALEGYDESRAWFAIAQWHEGYYKASQVWWNENQDLARNTKQTGPGVAALLEVRSKEDRFHEKYLQQAANRVSDLLGESEPRQRKVPEKAVLKKKKKKKNTAQLGVEKAAKARLLKVDL